MNDWNWRASYYGWIRRLWPWSAVLRQEQIVLSALLSSVKPEVKMLDIGSGLGHNLPLYRQFSLFVCDASAAMIRSLRKSYTVRALAADANHLPFRARSFGLVCCIGVMEYLPQADKLLQQAADILQPEGFLLLTVSPRNLLFYLRHAAGKRLVDWSVADLTALANKQGLQHFADRSCYSQQAVLLKKPA
jgi:SAM-dependent methyltransferase